MGLPHDVVVIDLDADCGLDGGLDARAIVAISMVGVPFALPTPCAVAYGTWMNPPLTPGNLRSSR